MRGDERLQEEIFIYGTLSQRVPERHPLRRVRALVDEALRELEPQFRAMYSTLGRPSIPPEQLLRALLLQMFYSIRSERMLMEQMDYNMLFRWFVGLGINEAVWDASSFAKNRERLLGSKLARLLFSAVLAQAKREKLLSDEHFSVDGTLIEAWASEKSYVAKPNPPQPGQGSGHDGEVLKRDTHGSTTDPDARLYRKGMKSALRLSHMAHAVSENNHGLVVDTEVTHCSPLAERQAGIRMLRRMKKTSKPRVVAADGGYHQRDFVEAMRRMNISPHVPRYRCNRKCLVDEALYDRPEYAQSQKRRKWIERFFSWLKNTAGLRKTRHTGHRKLDWNFTLAAAAYNLVRITKLVPAR